MQFGHVQRVASRAIFMTFRAVASMGVLWRRFLRFLVIFRVPIWREMGFEKWVQKTVSPSNLGQQRVFAVLGSKKAYREAEETARGTRHVLRAGTVAD